MKTFANILLLCGGILFLNTSIAMPQLSKPQIVEDKINMEKIKFSDNILNIIDIK